MMDVKNILQEFINKYIENQTDKSKSGFYCVKDSLSKKYHGFIKIKKFKNIEDLYFITNDQNYYLNRHDVKTNKDIVNFYRMFRSSVVSLKDINKINILSYCYNNSVLLTNVKEIPEGEKKITEFFEGTLVSIFNHNDTWHLPTTRNTDIYDETSYFKDKNFTFGKMFDECLEDLDTDKEKFLNKLDKEKSYYFIILHHKNKHNVNYSERFNEENYKKLCLLYVKDKDLNILNENLNDLFPGIINPETYETIDYDEKSFLPNKDYAITFTNNNVISFYKLLCYDSRVKNIKNPNCSNTWQAYHIIHTNKALINSLGINYNIMEYQKDNNIQEFFEINKKKMPIYKVLDIIYKETGIIIKKLTMFFINVVTGEKKNVELFSEISGYYENSIKGISYPVCKQLQRKIIELKNAIINNNIKTDENFTSSIKNDTPNNFFNLLKGLCYLHEKKKPELEHIMNNKIFNILIPFVNKAMLSNSLD